MWLAIRDVGEAVSRAMERAVRRAQGRVVRWALDDTVYEAVSMATSERVDGAVTASMIQRPKLGGRFS